MSKHDDKIAELLRSIETKKKTIGTKPKAAWKSNAILKFKDGTHVNINTITKMDACVEAVAYVLREQSSFKEAAKLLGVTYESSMDDYLDDLKLRAEILKWDEEKKKLDVLERKLKDLRSEDAKTADALDDIVSALG